MPGKLDPVSQSFTADTSGYIAGLEKAITANIAFIDSIDDVIRKSAEMAAALKSIPDVKRISVEVAGIDAAIGKVGALKSALDSLSDREVSVTVRHVGDAGTAGAASGMGADPLVLRELRDSSASLDMVSSTMGRVEEHLAIMRRDMADASADLMSQTAIMRSGGGGRSSNDAAVLAAAAALGMAGGGRRGGGGGGLGAAALAAAAPGGGGGPDPGTAAASFATVAAFVKRWYPAAHWAMMLTNEVLATVGPAAAAGGMGALVGMQGGEQAVPRLKAVFSTAESLGGSLGTTAGQYMGLKTPALQNAQDLATGAAFEAIGAMTNMMKAGAGAPFIQLGSGTVDMWSRMMANLTTEFQKGLGKQLGGLVSGGTGYLGQFGNVLGNLGHTFLNVAPNLPGVGGDLLSILQGGTKALSAGTGWLGPALGPILGFEAGARWGPPIVGGFGKLLATAGRPMITLGGALQEEALTAVSHGDLGVLSRAGYGAGRGLLAGGTGLAEAGAAIGTLTAPEIGAIAGTAFMVGKGLTYQTPGQQWAGGLVSQVNQAGIAQSMPMAIAAMQKLARVGPPDYPTSGFSGAVNQDLSNLFTTGRNLLHPKGQGWGFHPGALVTGVEAGIKGFWDEAVGGKTLPSNLQAANTAIGQLSQGLVNAFGAGQQVSDQWKKLTGDTIGMGKAFDVATMAQLQLGTSFEKNGKLTGQAKQMIANLQAGYAPMNMNTGQFGGAVAAQTAMSGLQHTQLAAVNTAWDQLTQLVQGGAASSAGLFGLLGGAPVASTRGKQAGVSLAAAAKGSRAFAASLGSFTSPGGAAAWNTLTSSQGIFPALEAQMNWLRTAQTMGSLTPGQAASMAGYDFAQIMPRLGNNPAALAMLSTYAQQFGGPSFAPGTSGKNMAAALRTWIGGRGLSGGQYNQLMTTGTVGMSSAGADAQQFVQQVGSGIAGALAQGIATHGASLQDAFMGSIHGGKHAGFSLPALEQYGKFLAGAGVPQAGAVDMAKYAAQLSGAGPGLQAMIGRQLGSLYAKLRVQADTSQAQAAIHNLEHVSQQPKVTVKADVGAAQAAINAIKGKDVPVSVKAQGISAIQGAIDALHGKTITITTINRLITQVIGMGTAPSGGIAPATLAGGPANMRLTSGGHQAGYRVPGYGGGDIVPAMLEPGEAVVPKHLVPTVAPFLGAHRVPGFADGGFVGQQVYGPGSYWGMGSTMALWNPAWRDQILANMGGIGPPRVSGPPHGMHALMAHAAASGGASSATLAQINAQIKAVWKTLDQLYKEKDAGQNVQSQINAVWKNQLDPLYAQKDKLTGASGGASGTGVTAAQLKQIAKEFNVTLGGEIAKEVKNSAAAKNIATALVNKIATEMNYATGVANAAAYGQGYDPTGKGSGIFGNMQLNPSGLTAAQMHASPTGNIKDYNAYVAAYAADTVGSGGAQSVQDQMKSYLATEKSFGTDLGKLRHQHLNKAVLAQLIAAGPQQGDALAQSILGGQGGVKGANKLWAQIQKASKGLGAQAAMGEYGGHVDPNLKSATIVNNNVSVSVTAEGGNSLSNLTPAQINQLVSLIQQKLLAQAKRNKGTGVKAKGKSS